MMFILQWTSCLFATVVVSAYCVGHASYHFTFLGVTVLSLLRWCGGGAEAPPCVCAADKLVAHAAFALVLWDTPKALERGHGWLLLLPLTVGVLWGLEHLNFTLAFPLHALLHVMAALGANAYLWCLHST